MQDLLNTVDANTNHAVRQAQATRRAMKTGTAKRIVAAAQLVASTFPDRSYTCVGVAGSTVYVTVTLRDLSGLKDPALMAALEALNNENPYDTDTTDYPTMTERDFIFRFEIKDNDTGFGTVIRVAVEARFKEDSATCRKVLVGYSDPQPAPIYELRCEDQE